MLNTTTMDKIIRSTRIDKIDKQLEPILSSCLQHKRDIIPSQKLEDSFPGCNIRDEKCQPLQVYVVGAGWEFPLYATALVAAGATVVAYEMNKEKIGRGQVGTTNIDGDLTIRDINIAHLMPTFTLHQLERLPEVITKITENEGYKNLKKKLDIARSIMDSRIPYVEKEKKYESDKINIISKREVIEVRKIIIDILQEEKVLQIIHQEVTIDIMQSWLNLNKPVLIVSGRQVNLKKMGLDHLEGTPGFVKEFSLNSNDTKDIIKRIRDKYDLFHTDPRSHTRPSVALVGGGPISSTCVKDLLKEVAPKYPDIVLISPHKPEKRMNFPKGMEQIERAMKFKLIPGHVSQLTLSQDEKKVEAVEIVSPPHSYNIPCDLLIHTTNDIYAHQEKGVLQAMERITGLLDEKTPENGLVRYRSILPDALLYDLPLCLSDPLTVSLEDDEVLKKEIQKLVRRQKEQEQDVSLVVTGDNSMTKAIKLVSVSLGYCGRFIQVSEPNVDRWVRDSKEMLEQSKKMLEESEVKPRWIEIDGRLVQDGTAFKNGNFSLGVRDGKGQKVQDVSDVDIIINAAGKTSRTPLIEAMLEKGFVTEVESNGQTYLCSNHPTLFGQNGLFREKMNLEAGLSVSLTLYPQFSFKRLIRPWGWDETFHFARKMIEQSKQP